MHYLERELRDLLKTDDSIFDFLERGSLDGVWYWDLDNLENEWMSPRFWQVMGYDPTQRDHKAAEWQDLIHPDDLTKALENFERHREDPEHPYDQVVRYRHRDGSTVWVRCRGLIVRDADGRPYRMLGAHQDVTHEHEATDRLTRANKQLDAFAAHAAHDLRSPLRHVNSYLQVLIEDFGEQLPEQARKLVDRAQARLHWANQLISQLLGFSRAIDAQSLEFQPVPLSRVVGEAKDLLEEEINRTGAVVEIEALPTVHAASGALTEVMVNLLKNACTYSRDGIAPVITIRSVPTASPERADNCWYIEVSDNGIGIPADRIGEVTEPFKRLHGSERPGHGLGLAICNRIMELHGGNLLLESAVGEGTRVTVVLPKTPGSALL